MIYGKHTFRRLRDGQESSNGELYDYCRICPDDAIGFGCIRAAIELDVCIEEDDLSLIRFNNVEVTEVISTPLYHHSSTEIRNGQAAMEMLLKVSAGTTKLESTPGFSNGSRSRQSPLLKSPT